MTRIINLRRVRKARARDDKARDAQENRVKFGRTTGEKQRDRRTHERASAHVEAHRREVNIASSNAAREADPSAPKHGR